MSRTTTLALLLFAAASLSAQTPDTPPAATNPPAPAQAAESSEAKPLPDSVSVIIKDSFPVIYSKDAEDKKLHGTVVLSVLFNEAGAEESSEVSSGDPLLAECVTVSIGKWQIEPFIRGGKPVKVKVPLTFEFVYDEPQVSFTPGQEPPSPPSGPTPNRVILGSPGTRGMLVNKVQPEYPSNAKAAHSEGSVILAAAVGKEGAVQKLYVVSGDPLLAKAAGDAVRQWRCKPYLHGGNPVAFDVRIQVNFTLAPL